MEQKILKQLEMIEKSNAWIKSSLDGEKQKNAYRNMVNCRRRLSRKKIALESNPAAAIYGESQAGKSYLVSALLSKKGNSFKIFDGGGNEFDFKNQINPRGNEMESTSVVTRFSTKYKWINQNYPIIAKLLSPTDIIIIICEAYYNNLKVNKSLNYNEIKEKKEFFQSFYANKPECQYFITEDEILDLEEYFNDNFSQLVYNNIKDVNFFEQISSLVTKIAPEEWKDVFSLLWNFNPQLTKLFDDLIKQYKQLDFVDTVYLSIDAVLRDNGTLLDVSRLDEMYDSSKEQKTEIFYKDKNGKEKTVNFSKSYLCALSAELIFVLPETIEKDKPFLAQTDLLDFPGIRRFESTNEDDISNESLTQLLRRGRVDYLFNKYSYNERINVLLFCQNHKQSNQSVMPEKLNRWISNMIGKTPAEREGFNAQISPLFVISTWFNKDLEYDHNNDNPQSLKEKWNQRFSKTLEKEIFKIDTYSWLIEWTVSNPNFQNIYLLRDFDKSSNLVYKGFNQYEQEKEEIKHDSYPTFREDLRTSFIDYPFVKQHFENPANSWDEAASINKDGTQLIIDKLTIAANNINNTRREKTLSELNKMLQIILDELSRHFHSNDKDEELEKARSIAGAIQFKLDSAFDGNGIKYFGQLMKEFMLDESSVLELYRKKIYDIEHRDEAFTDNIIFQMQVPVTESDTTVDIYFDRLCVHYEKTTEEQKQQFHAELEAKEIDLEEIIRGNPSLIKNNAQQLAESLLDYWLASVTSSDKHMIQRILAHEGSSALQDITDMFQKLFKKADITKRIAEKIRRYVGGYNKTDPPYEIAADISAELLNKCINTVSYEYFDESELNDLKKANEQNKLGLIFDQHTNPTEKTVKELLEKIENSNPNEIKSSPRYRNYLLWYNRLKIGFVSVCNIPNYDVAANERLGTIIKECETIGD